MNPQSVTISVIVPIYNDELYLRDALQSIQQQMFANFECICVNDGSNDGSEKIIDEFIGSDSRFLKINRKNGGVSAARNAGMDIARGEYLFFMDHDDLIPDYTLQNLWEAAQKFDADMARGRMMMIADDFTLEQLPKDVEQKKRQVFFQNPLSDFYRHIRGKNKTWCYVWQCLFRRSAIKNARFLEDLRAGGEDNLFMFDVISKINNFVQINDIVTCHRFSKTSITLNGFNPSLIKMFETIVPFIYIKYALDKNIDKRLLWWVYRKESYAVYRFLIRDTIRTGSAEHRILSREILLKLQGTAGLNEIVKRWNCRQKIFYRLFMREKYNTLKKISFFM